MGEKKAETMKGLGTPIFYVLYALADRPRHGYGIILEVEERTEGKVRIGSSTLYTNLQRMLGGGLIEECASPDCEQEDDERRRYYRLTQDGRRTLKQEVARLQDLQRLVEVKKIGSS